MSPITKRQHFVPRVFLKNFSEPHGDGFKIWAKRKTDDNNRFQINTKNVCLQKHIYTINFPEATEKEMMLLEDFYSKNIESNYDEIFGLLNDNERTEITINEKLKIIETIISFHYRVAKWFNQSLNAQKEIIEELFVLASKFDKPLIELPDGKIYDISTKTVGEIMDDLEPTRKLEFIMQQLNAINSVPTHFLNYSISVNHVYGGHRFLTSDVPIVLNNGEACLVEILDSDCHIMLNISPTRCLTIMPSTGTLDLKINRVQMEDASSLLYCLVNNDHQLRNSERFLLGSKEGMDFYDECKGITETEEAIKMIIAKAEEELQGIKNMYNKFYYSHLGKKN